jgi:hypothetical protein
MLGSNTDDLALLGQRRQALAQQARADQQAVIGERLALHILEHPGLAAMDGARLGQRVKQGAVAVRGGKIIPLISP